MTCKSHEKNMFWEKNLEIFCARENLNKDVHSITQVCKVYLSKQQNEMPRIHQSQGNKFKAIKKKTNKDI